MSRYVSAAARWKSLSYLVSSGICKRGALYNRARTYDQTKNKKQKFIVSLGERKQKLSSKDLIFDGGHELLYLPDFTGSLILTRLPSSLTLRYQSYAITYYDDKMGAYKYLEEIWRKKQSDVLRFLLRVR